jgi:hypothetical protein
MNDFHFTGLVDIPAWANGLHYPYWKIRNEGRDTKLRRKMYHKVRKEKVRLVELGYDIDLINAICKYLVSHREVNAARLKAKLRLSDKQLTLKFTE